MARRTVEIAGAGLAGLSIAVRLAQLGWHVRMHERGKDLRMFGAGIWLWENGLKSLQILGAYEQTVKRAKTIKEWRVADGAGNILMARHCTPDDKLLLPPRADLYQALIDRAVELGVDIETSSVAVGARPEGVLIMEDGRELKADLVIAADGAYSRVRESCYCTSSIDYGSEAGIRMLIDWNPSDPEDICTEYWQGPWRLLFNPCTDSHNYIFLSAPVLDERSRQMPIDRDLWAKMLPHAKDLIDRCTAAEGARWDRIVNVRCHRWSEGKVAVIGDAAHAMPPNLGQAANMAFTNAMSLALTVTESQDVPDALTRWEKKQRPLTDHVQWFSYIYGLLVAKTPASMLPLRSDLVRGMAKTEWFEWALNRGARTVPDGYEPSMAPARS